LQKLSKKNYTKIGILGGTFDPPHKGHLYISKIALKKLKLDKLMWIVTKKNPLKQKPYLNIKTRIKLSKKITKNEKKIFVEYFDDKIRSSHTFNLLNYLKKISFSFLF
jgi:nicotinate-nucleotide adenylyltransferase